MKQLTDVRLTLRKRTLIDRVGMSALCQKRTLGTTTKINLFDHLVGGVQQAQRHVEAKTPVSLLNEPADFAVDFAVEEPKHESATKCALRRWFERNPTAKNESAG